MIELVCEAAWAAPEYGGNPGGAGWKLIHFEGDALPLGYSQWNGSEHVERPEAPLSPANPSDPEPLSDDIRQVLATVISELGGRSTRGAPCSAWSLSIASLRSLSARAPAVGRSRTCSRPTA